MPTEPVLKRAIAFIDGQNLFYAVRESFGYTFPNYDVLKLSTAVCNAKGWSLTKTYFYTGVPDSSDNYRWNVFWTSKLAGMARQGVDVFSRPLRYRNRTIILPKTWDSCCRGKRYTFIVGNEKGIDVRLALDSIRLAFDNEYDVALFFCQDQDLSEAAKDIRRIGKSQKRWIKLASAYPYSPVSKNKRGIDTTDWIHIDRAMYDSCIDPKDYRPKK